MVKTASLYSFPVVESNWCWSSMVSNTLGVINPDLSVTTNPNNPTYGLIPGLGTNQLVVPADPLATPPNSFETSTATIGIRGTDIEIVVTQEPVNDNNPGTFPIQTQRLYQALAGTGGHVRYVSLPFESHGYSARESIGHTLREMSDWMKRQTRDPRQ